MVASTASCQSASISCDQRSPSENASRALATVVAVCDLGAGQGGAEPPTPDAGIAELRSIEVPREDIRNAGVRNRRETCLGTALAIVQNHTRTACQSASSQT